MVATMICCALLPLSRYGGFSYTDVMLKPLADAMAAALAPQTRVWFAMQGEMGLMVFKYPDEHRRLLPYLKWVCSIIIMFLQ